MGNSIFSIEREVIEKLKDEVSQSDLLDIEEEKIKTDFQKDVYDIYQAGLGLKNIIEKYEDDYNTETVSQLILYGTDFIMNLRSFLTKETLEFVLGGQVEAGGPLQEIHKKQDELFNFKSNMLSVLKDGSIVFVNYLDQLKKANAVQNGLLAQWNDVLSWTYIDTSNPKSPINPEDNDNKFYHQAAARDINVYMKYTGRKSYYYYDVNNFSPKNRDDLTKHLIHFNNGWLYEWIKAVDKDPNYKWTKFNSKSKTPLKSLFKFKQDGEFRARMDNVPGLSGGDEGLEQYKYLKKEVLTVQNIRSVLLGEGQMYASTNGGLLHWLKELSLTGFSENNFKNLVQIFFVKNDKGFQNWISNHLDEFEFNLNNKS